MNGIARRLVLVLVCLAPSQARAEDVTGTWNASALAVSWAVGDWGDACGPRPSGGGSSASRVELTQQGAEFSLTGAGRNYRTTSCWEQMPGLTPKSHSAGSSTIRTSCAMPAGDPRQASVVTTWALRGDSIYFDETGQYQFVVEGSNCTASVRRTRVLTRVKEATPAAPAAPSAIPVAPLAAPVPAPEPVSAPLAPPSSATCENPGKPIRVEVSPLLKLMRAGESFAFQATARDGRGCRVRVTPRFRIVSGQELGRLDANLALVVDPNAASGRIELEAEVANQTVRIAARVVSQEEYEKLLAGGEFGAQGESLEIAAATLTSSSVGIADGAEAPVDSKRGAILLALLGASILAGAGALFFVLRRARRRNSLLPSSLPPGSADAPPVSIPRAPQPPTFDRAPAAPAAPDVSLPEAPLPEVEPSVVVPGKVCPVCGKIYGVESTFCGQDGARLVRSN